MFDHVSGVAPAPPATADDATRSQWLSRDATARLAIRNHLPVAECTHFEKHKTAQASYDAIVACHSSPTIAALGRLLLPYLFPELSAFATVTDLVTHLCTSDACYRASVPAEFLNTNQPPMFITLYFIVSRLPDSLHSVRDQFLSLDPTSLTVDLLEQHLLAAETSAIAVDVSVTEDVDAASTSVKHRSSKGKGGRGGGGGSGGGGGGSGSHGGGSSGGAGGSGGIGGGGTGGGTRGSGGGGGGSGGSGGSGGGGTGGGRSGPWHGGPGGGQRQLQHRRSKTESPQQLRVCAGQTCGEFHIEHRCFSSLDDAWCAQFGDDVKRPRWKDFLRSGVAIFDLDYDAVISFMYALSSSAEGDCYRCVPFEPSIAAATLGASTSGTPPGTTPAQALHTFTSDSGASRWSRLYNLATEPPHVAASAQVSASCQVAASCSCRLLSHQILLWHHRQGHPSLQRLRGMHSQFLFFGLPRSLPPLPPLPALPCLPCVEGRQRAAPQSSSFPLTTAPLQTLHMDVWGPAQISGQGRERYFLLVIDDYTRYTTVFPLRSKGEVVDVLIPWIRKSVSSSASASVRTFLSSVCTLSEVRRIGLFTEVARTSMIHAAASHFLWPFAVRYAAHQLNLWPRVSLPETSPTLRWTGKVGNASVFRVWGYRAFVRDTSADKLSARAIPCVFLGFVLDVPGWQFYHPTLRRVLPSHEVTFDESVPFYRPFPYRSAAPPPLPLFLAPGPPPVDPLLPQVPAPSGVSQVDPLPRTAPVQVAVGSIVAPGAASGGAEPGGAGSKGAVSGAVEPEGVEPGGAESEGVECGGAALLGAASSGDIAGASLRVSSQKSREWLVQRIHLQNGGPGAVGARDNGAGGAAVTLELAVLEVLRLLVLEVLVLVVLELPGLVVLGALELETLRSLEQLVLEALELEELELEALAQEALELPELELDALASEALELQELELLTLAVEVLEALCGRNRTSFPPLQQVLGVPSSTGLSPPFLCPPPDQSQPPLQPAYPLPAPFPYNEQSGGLTERREPASCPVSPVRTTPRAPRLRPPPVPDLASDRARAASSTVTCLLATAVTDPSIESATASALVAEPLDFAAACCLDYATSLVAESIPACPPFVGVECGIGMDILEDRQEDFECLEAAVPRFASLLLAPEGDPDAPDIATPRSYAEAIMGPYSSQWQAAMDAEMASWKVKQPPGSLPAFKARYVARGFSQRHLHEEIWLRRPPGFTRMFPAGTRWSRRPVYGLCQAPREWHDTQRTTLAALGFAPSTADPSLFLCTDTSLTPFYFCEYVDDLVFATADTEALTLVKFERQKRHNCTELGELRSYLGLQINWDRARRTITLAQSHMVHQVLQRFGFQFSSPQPTPLSTSHSLSAPPSDESVEPSGPFPELVGCLVYLMTCTRPDLAYPLILLACYMAPGRHRKVHWDAVKRVLRYLCSMLGMGLVLGGQGPVVLTGHTDASWVDDSATQRSSQGYTFSLGSGSVSWWSTCSSLVLSSSFEAEIYAGANAAQELRWLTYLLTVLGEQPHWPPRRVSSTVNAAALGACESAATPSASASAATGASESAASADALYTFTLDSGMSRCFFRNCTTVTPLAAPVPVSLADPFGAPSSHEPPLSSRPCPPSHAKLSCRAFPASRLGLSTWTCEARPPGGKFSSGLLAEFCRDEGIIRLFTLPASPQQNGIAERCIGLIMEVARTSMIHVAAPHFLWPFAVRYAAHQLNLWPRVSLPETSPTLCWTGEVGDASAFQVDPPPLVEPLKISSDSSGPAEGGDIASDDTAATRRSPRLETPRVFLPRPSSPPLQPVAVDTGAAGGGDTGGEDAGGAGPGGAEIGGAETGGGGSGGAETEGAASPSGGGAVGAPAAGPGAGQLQPPSRLETSLSQQVREWVVQGGHSGVGAWSYLYAGAAGVGGTAGGAAGAGAGGVGGTTGDSAGAGVAGGAGATSAGGAAGAGGTGTCGTGGPGGAGAAGLGGACTGGHGHGACSWRTGLSGTNTCEAEIYTGAMDAQELR
ncbi:unnamed protein product [Closterium sp. NIES-53]